MAKGCGVMIAVIQEGYEEWVKANCLSRYPQFTDGKTVLIKKRCLVWDTDAQGNDTQAYGYHVRATNERMANYIPARFLKVYR